MEQFLAEVSAPVRNPLAGIPSVECKVSVYVPTTIHDQPAPAWAVKYQRDAVKESLSRWFGGYTEVSAQGGWYSEQLGKLIVEEVYVVQCGCTQQALNRCLPSVLRLAAKVALALSQEAVTVEVDGKMYFVPASLAQSVPA